MIKISTRQQKIIAIVIVADSDKIIVPCGACRQQLIEFSDSDMQIHMFDRQGNHQMMTMAEMLPATFSNQYLKNENN